MRGLTPPVLVGDLHLDAPLPACNTEGRYRGARLLAWLHGRPLCEVSLPLEPRPLTTGGLAAKVWPLVAEPVARHFTGDGLPAPRHLPGGGLDCPPGLRCPGLRPPAGAPPVTVVIATRDRTASLLRCLASVSRLDYPCFDVVVVESAPASNETTDALTRQPWPFPLRHVRVDTPGLALAHNAALGLVTGEVVAITDDDVEVDRGWLSALAGAFGQPRVACVTGLILPAELETRAQLLVEQAGGFGRGLVPRTFTKQPRAGGGSGEGPLFPFTAGRFGSGANMAFRTGWLTSRGGFDPAAGAGTPARGGDDLIAFLKVITDGQALAYEPAAVVRHWHRRDYEGMRRQAFGYGAGLSAYLTASVLARPMLAGAMARRSAAAVRHLLDPASPKNDNREPGFPRELVWRERAGVLAGPAAYAFSRWRYRGCRW